MRQYLGSTALQTLVRDYWKTGRPVAAICHGVLVLARAGVLDGRRTTCLTKYQERSAYYLTAWKLGRYYRTYDAYVEDEVRAAGARFERGPISLIRRGTDGDDRPAFVVEDGAYLSARWPGDAWAIAKRFSAKLEAAHTGKEAA
jgi:putative intracellular protease/amidase